MRMLKKFCRQKQGLGLTRIDRYPRAGARGGGQETAAAVSFVAEEAVGRRWLVEQGLRVVGPGTPTWTEGGDRQTRRRPKGLQGPAKTLGRRTHLRPARPRLRNNRILSHCLHLPRPHTHHAPQARLISGQKPIFRQTLKSHVLKFIMHYPANYFNVYVDYWRVMLVGVLGWSEKMFSDFCRFQHDLLLSTGELEYFHDLPYKYVYRELLSEKLKTNPSGTYKMFAGRHLVEAISGEGGCSNVVTEKDFDIGMAKSRYLAELRRLEANLENDWDK